VCVCGGGGGVGLSLEVPPNHTDAIEPLIYVRVWV